MTHLGTQVSALADGQLSPTATERALAHVAVCAECEAELRAARAARRALAAAMDVPVAPDLTARLLAMGCPGPADAADRRRPVRSFDDAPVLPGSRRADRVPADCLRGELGRSRVSSRVLMLTGAGLGVVVAGLVVIGDQPAVVPAMHPADALSMLGHVPGEATAGSGTQTVVAFGSPRTTRSVTSAPEGIELSGAGAHEEILTWMRDEGWSRPGALPDGLRVTSVQLDDGVLELDLVSPEGSMVILEEHGRLQPDAVADAEVLEVDGREIRVLSGEPWHGVWQSGDTVVSIVASVPEETVHELIKAYPRATYDDGLPARIARGWSTLAGHWSP